MKEVWAMLILCTLGLGISVFGLWRDVEAQQARPRRVEFYLDQPTCEHPLRVIVDYPGEFYLTQHQWLWMCVAQ